jgi:hypothetical protein
MVGGVYGEVVYDNMRNVVATFIGKNEKELNAGLIAMSTYYGFSLNVTNCFRGNEKGYVESSVKAVRNEAFAVRYKFNSIEEAEQYLEEELRRMNAGSEIEEEMKHLLPYRPPLELAKITEQLVDKYSFIRVENNFYSVPEYLVGRTVTVKNHVKEIIVYSGLHEVCRHNKKDGFLDMSVNIFHYLDTLAKKPGAVRNSKALRGEPELKTVFDRYYTKRVKEFIELLRGNQDKPVSEAVRVIEAAGAGMAGSHYEPARANVLRHTAGELYAISDFFMKGGAGHVH